MFFFLFIMNIRQIEKDRRDTSFSLLSGFTVYKIVLNVSSFFLLKIGGWNIKIVVVQY